MAEGNNSFAGGDIIEWNHQKITDYFAECGKVYDTFEESINEVAIALNDFVNDGEHRGPEAESAKSFVNERQIQVVEEAIYSVEHLHGMMEGSRLSDEVSLLDDFNERVDASETAIVKSQHLDKVITDYTEYNNGFRTDSDTIKTARDACQDAVSGCSFLTYTKFTEPDPEPTKETMEAFVSVENEDGFVQKFEKTFLEFIEEHDDDFTGSEFMAICPVLLENLKNVNAALGDGSFDLTRYDETFKNVRWTDVKGLISEEMRNKFLKYMKDFNLYLKGCLEKCQVIKYDPVNMNNGNYINDRTDLTVPGRFPIDFRRFYNAQSDKSGILGKGWSCAFDGRLRKDMDGDIRLTTFDGRELIFSKANIKKEEVYLEVHGEEGVLRETQTGYVITRDDGSYDEYDLDGFLVARGDNNGEHTRVDYAVINVSEKTAVEDADENVSEATSYIAVPVKIATKDGASLSLRYNEAGILKEIEDHTGRKCTFEYELKLVNRDNEEIYFLKSVTYPNGSSRIYNYNDQGLIASVKSPDGVVALENEYDSKRRVIHQSFPDGGEMSYEYDDENRITTATEQNGCKVQYLSDEFGRHVGTRYVGIRPGQVSMDETLESDTYTIEEKFTYNDKNQKTTVTDRNGFVTRYLYDNRGRLVSTIGPEGLHEIITYDAEGHMTSKKDSNGNKYKYSYDLDGNLYCVRDPEGNRIKYDYVEGKLVSKRDGFDKKTEFSYDENGNVKSITEPTGKKTFYEYDSLGRAIKSIDAEGNATCYTYDNDGNITSVTDPLGNVTRHTYNKAGLLVETVNPDGTKKIWQYNEIGRPASFTDEDGRTTRMLYNTMWQEAKTILPNGGEISYKYDLLGNRISITDPENRVTKFTHDKMGNVLTEGHVVSSKEDVLEIVSVNKTYTYDAKNRVKTETDGEGNVTTYKYDKNDNLICKTDALGGQTINEYDGLNRLVKTTDPAGRTTSYTFDKNGNLKTTTDPSGVITENHYDNNLLIKVTQRTKADEDVEITINKYTYDDLGRMATQVERDGFTLNYEYDKAGRVVKTTASNGRVIEYSYDPMGRVTEKKDCEAVTKYAYTGTGKLKSVIDALGNETRYTYNELDLLCRVERFDGLSNNEVSADIITDSSETDFGVDFVNVTIEDAEGISEANAEEKEHSYPQIDRHGHVTIYTHDLSGKVISVTDALGNKDVYKYDRKGELCAETDRDGNETIYTRDNNGNITGIKYSNGEQIKYSYNALNILKEVEDHLGITKIESDAVGRTTQVTTPDGQSVSYEYGPDDAKTAIIYPNGKRLEYKYDAFRKLVELSDLSVSTGSVKYYYDSNARLMKKAFPNGTTTSYDYYQGGLLKTLINTDKEGVLDRFEYSYNHKGNRTSIEKTRRGLDNVSGIYAYNYDEVGRLEEVSREGEVLSTYTYDAFGNRIIKIENNSKTFYAYDVQDRLVSKSNQNGVDPTPVITTYSYDNRGNLVAEYKNDVLDREYTYSARNLLEKAQINADPSKDQSISYDYNYLGQRISKKSDNTEVSYLTDITMDHNNLLAQSVNGQTSMFTYDDKVVSMENEDTSSFYLLDELGSTMYLTGTDGISSDAYAYDVFGNRVDVNTGKKALLENLIQPFTFTGYREEENGLYFAQARSYDSETGRFTGEDKVRGYLETPDSINHYQYCFNAPTEYIDRNGQYPESSDKNISNAGPYTASTSISDAANGGATSSPAQTAANGGNGGYANGSLTYVAAKKQNNQQALDPSTYEYYSFLLLEAMGDLTDNDPSNDAAAIDTINNILAMGFSIVETEEGKNLVYDVDFLKCCIDNAGEGSLAYNLLTLFNGYIDENGGIVSTYNGNSLRKSYSLKISQYGAGYQLILNVDSIFGLDEEVDNLRIGYSATEETARNYLGSKGNWNWTNIEKWLQLDIADWNSIEYTYFSYAMLSMEDNELAKVLQYGQKNVSEGLETIYELSETVKLLARNYYDTANLIYKLGQFQENMYKIPDSMEIVDLNQAKMMEARAIAFCQALEAMSVNGGYYYLVDFSTVNKGDKIGNVYEVKITACPNCGNSGNPAIDMDPVAKQYNRKITVYPRGCDLSTIGESIAGDTMWSTISPLASIFYGKSDGSNVEYRLTQYIMQKYVGEGDAHCLISDFEAYLDELDKADMINAAEGALDFASASRCMAMKGVVVYIEGKATMLANGEFDKTELAIRLGAYNAQNNSDLTVDKLISAYQNADKTYNNYNTWFCDIDNQKVLLYYEDAVTYAAIQSGYTNASDLNEDQIAKMISLVNQALENIGEDTVSKSNLKAIENEIKEIISG